MQPIEIDGTFKDVGRDLPLAAALFCFNARKIQASQ